MKEEEAWTGTVMEFWAYDRPLETVLLFKYLRRLLTTTNNDWLMVIANLLKVRKSWSCLDRILGKEGADTWRTGCFYVMVVQAILLFGSEMWVVTTHIKWLLGGFHHRVAQRISGKIPWKQTEEMWELPSFGGYNEGIGNRGYQDIYLQVA